MQRKLELTQNMQHILSVFDGKSEAQGALLIAEADMRSLHAADEPIKWNTFFVIFQNLITKGKAKPGLKIELTEHAAGVTFAGIEILERHLITYGFPEGVSVSIRVNDDSHPMIKNKALRLARMFSHHDPYQRLVAFMRDPQSDNKFCITAKLREKYDSEHGNLVNDFVNLLKQDKMPPRCSFVFELNSILNYKEAKQIYNVVRSGILPTQFDLFILPSCKDRSNVIQLQDAIYDTIHGKLRADDELAFGMLMKAGIFSQIITNKISMQDQGAAEYIYKNMEIFRGDQHERSLALQSHHIQERITAGKWSRFFNAVAAVGGAAFVGLAISSVLKKNV